MIKNILTVFRLSLWATILLVLLTKPVSASTGPAGATALSEVLNSDGTVQAGARGSFNAKGYTMGTTPDGRPTFLPAATRQVLGAGDANWSTDFRITGVNGLVYAMAVDGNGDVYIGGVFTAVGGVAAANIARWNGTTWAPLGTGNTSGGIVDALAVDGSGALYAGGNFLSMGGVSTVNIAKWNGSVWSPLGTGTDAYVGTLAVDASGNLYAGGTFDRAGGIVAHGIAKWNGTTWSPLGLGSFDNVVALAVDDTGTLYAGGAFTTIGNVAAKYVAKWNGTTWAALGTGLNNVVFALAVDKSGNLYAGGAFSTAGGIAANHVAKWTGTAWAAMGAGTSSTYTGDSSYGTVYALLADAKGNVYAGGNFTTAGSVGASNIAQWNGTTWTALGTGVSNGYTKVQALALASTGTVYAVGNFSTAGDLVVNGVAQWVPTTSTWARLRTPFSPTQGLNGSVGLLLADGSGGLYVTGGFSAAGDKPFAGIARWNGTTWSEFMGGICCINAIVVDSKGILYVNGSVGTGSAVVSGIFKWTGTAWARLGPSGTEGGEVSNLAVDNRGNLYASGTFTKIGGVAANYVAKWDGTTWSALGTGLSYFVTALAVDSNGLLYVGGQFSFAGNVRVNHIAKWNGTTWSPLSTGTDGDDYGSIYTLAVDRLNNLYAGGGFTTAGGLAANHVAKWDGTTWTPLGAGVNNTVYKIAIDESSNVYVGGLFTTAGATTVNHVAKWTGAAWVTLGTGTNGTVYALAPTGTGVYVGGSFTTTADASKVMSYLGYYSATPLATTMARPLLGLELFPNPAGTRTTVQVPGVPGVSWATLTLLDALGRVVRTQRVPLPVGGTQAELELINLSPGIYWLQVQAGKQQANRTLVVN